MPMYNYKCFGVVATVSVARLTLVLFVLFYHLCTSEIRKGTQYELFSSNVDFLKWVFAMTSVE